MSTKMLPRSPLDIRNSSSRYVVSSHDCALLLLIGIFNGGCPEIVLATDEAASWIEENIPLKGVRSTFCPKNSKFSGSTMESVS
jgi:hypothetical protein